MNTSGFYLKERKPFIFLFGFLLILSMFLIIYSLFFLDENPDNTVLRYLVRSILLIPAIIIYIVDLIKFLLVFHDYKKQNIVENTFCVIEQNYKKCIDEFNGVYTILFCGESMKSKPLKLTYYNADLLYDIKVGKKYIISYYKNSKFVLSIKPLSQTNTKKQNDYNSASTCSLENTEVESESINDKQNKMINIFALLGLILVPFTVFALIKLYAMKSIIDNFMIVFSFVGVSFVAIHFLLMYKFLFRIVLNTSQNKNELKKDTIIVRGIPVNKEFSYPHRQGYYLKTITDSGKKLDLFFFSINVLGLGDLSERPGYKGFGNFIGAKYEVEYYKISKIIKTMKLINEQSRNDW